MEILELKGKMRERTGKEVCRKLRREGLIPAVVYGKSVPVSITVQVKPLLQILKEAGENAIVRLSLEGEDQNTRQVIVRELQIHPVKRAPLHADFYEISMDREIEVEVPIRTIGKPEEAIREGALVSLLMKEVRVECLPTRIPEWIEVDVSSLSEGDVLHVKDLRAPEGVRLLHDPDEVLLTVSTMKEEEVAEEEAPTEPEVVGKGRGTAESEEK